MANCETQGHVLGRFKCLRCGKPNPNQYDALEIPLRDQFALAAMQEILTGQIVLSQKTRTMFTSDDYRKIAFRSYRMSDAMLSVRKIEDAK